LFLTIALLVEPLEFSNAHAKDLGIDGTIYKIKEKDGLSYIKDKLNDMEQSGEIAKHQKEWVEKTEQRVKRPKAAIENPLKATEYKVRYFDPTITLKRDIRDISGNFIAKRGEQINPFEKALHIDLNLIFIDGDDVEQVLFAKEQLKSNKYKKHIILIRGNIMSLMEKYQVRLYFDQQANLINHFSLNKFPSVLTREGNKIKIEEVAL
jgi:conjugal transfer pilus assembly protein TraW